MAKSSSNLNASPKTALEQGGTSGMREPAMDAKDVLIYPKPDGSRPIAQPFPMEHSPSGT